MDNPDIPTTLGIHDTGRKQKTNKNKEKKNKQNNKQGTTLVLAKAKQSCTQHFTVRAPTT